MLKVDGVYGVPGEVVLQKDYVAEPGPGGTVVAFGSKFENDDGEGIGSDTIYVKNLANPVTSPSGIIRVHLDKDDSGNDGTPIDPGQSFGFNVKRSDFKVTGPTGTPFHVAAVRAL